MRKCIYNFIVLFLVLSFSPNCLACELLAVEAEEVTSLEYLDNGCYLETSLEILPQVESSTNTRSASKTVNYKTSAGEVMWSITVSGTFSYQEGISCTCTSVSGSSNSYDSTWKVSAVTTSKKNNTASASATGKHYLGISVIETLDKTVTLTCDTYGNFS